MPMKTDTQCYPSLDRVREAQNTLRGIAERTPLQQNLRLSRKYGAEVFLKREDLQPVRSYKIRGAYNKIHSLYQEGKLCNGIVCASAGNHAQGVAFACSRLKIRGTVFMPVTTPKQKLEQVAMFGEQYIDIRLHGDTFDAAKSAAVKFSAKSAAAFIHPFDDARIIEGQATLALEILSQADSTIDYIFVPVGGGGLLAGIVTVFSALSPETRIVSVEPKGAASMKKSLASGQNTKLEEMDSFVDGAAVQMVGQLPFDICREAVYHSMAVDEGKVCETLLEMYNREAMVLEPAGALSVAGMESFHGDLTGKNVVCIISGSNNDITRMEEIKERALLYKGLKHYFIVRFAQRPGALKEFVLNVLGDTDDITFFEYTKKNSREKSSAIVGIEVAEPPHFEILLENMKRLGYFEFYLNESPDMMNIMI